MPYPGTQPGPAWYDSTYLFRWPIAVDAVTGGDSGAVDINVSVPATWDWFWDNVQDTTNGYDIIVCGSDGVTLLDFQYSGYNHTNRTLTIQIDAFTLAGTGKMEMIWVYWNKTSASNLTTPFTPASPISGYITVALPQFYRLTATQMNRGETSPTQAIQVAANDVVSVGIDLTPALPLSSKTYNGKYNYTGVNYVTNAVAAGGSGATAADANTRFTYYNDRLYAIGKYTGHSADGTDTGTISALLTDAQDFEFRFGIQTEVQVYS